jgi:predicted CxxxxCH...CXXCH cytochrome family protein
VKEPTPFGSQASSCNACHGSEINPAPPPDVTGNTYTGFIGVGSHQSHVTVTNYSRAFDCTECHIKPTKAREIGHIDDSTSDAEVRFDSLATDNGTLLPFWNRNQATCMNVYCHGEFPRGDTANDPVWTNVGDILCGTCHRIPPPSPHPSNTDCSACHATVINPDYSFTIPGRDSLHVNGQTDF